MINIRPATWIAGAVLLAALFIFIIHLSANNIEFSRSNLGWNGTSSFFSDLDRHRSAEISDHQELAAYPHNATLLIIAPHKHPTSQELTAYRTFLQQGNLLFLADDFGSGNEILAGLDSHISILPGNLSSLDRKYPDPYSVVVYRSPAESPVKLPNILALNRPAPLNGGLPLMLTSVMSWTDANGDHRLNTGESMGTTPVMATEFIGSGQIVVLSDPSIFINSMYSSGENENNVLFIRSIIDSDGPVLIDQMNSRTANSGGLGEILHVIRNTVNIEIFIISLLMLIAAWAWKKKIV